MATEMRVNNVKCLRLLTPMKDRLSSCAIVPPINISKLPQANTILGRTVDIDLALIIIPKPL